MSNIKLVEKAWEIAGSFQYGFNINCLYEDSEFKNQYELSEFTNKMFDGLCELSKSVIELNETNDQGYRNSEDQIGYYGHCIINDVDCYWWKTNASFEWTCDKLDFWDEV